jgi:hypothetical protein
LTEKGVPKERVVLGLGTYGKSFKLKNQEENAPGALNDGVGAAGKVKF